MDLEYIQLHKKPYSSLVCEFGGFENVLRDMGHPYITSTDVYLALETIRRMFGM